MKCEQFEIRLNDILDDRRQPESDSTLMTHASECDNCRSFLDGARQLTDHFENVVIPPMSSHLAEEIVTAALQPSKSTQQNSPASPEAVLVRDTLPIDSHQASRPPIAAGSQVESNAPIHQAVTKPETKTAVPAQDSEVAIRSAEFLMRRSRRLQWIRSPQVVAAAAALLVVTTIAAAWIANQLNSIRNDRMALENLATHPDNSAESNRRSNRLDGMGDSGFAHSSNSRERRFLGPTPFSTGGNVAVALTMMPTPLERMGLNNFDANPLPISVMPIADSFGVVVDALWESIPQIGLRMFR